MFPLDKLSKRDAELISSINRSPAIDTGQLFFEITEVHAARFGKERDPANSLALGCNPTSGFDLTANRWLDFLMLVIDGLISSGVHPGLILSNLSLHLEFYKEFLKRQSSING